MQQPAYAYVFIGKHALSLRERVVLREEDVEMDGYPGPDARPCNAADEAMWIAGSAKQDRRDVAAVLFLKAGLLAHYHGAVTIEESGSPKNTGAALLVRGSLSATVVCR